MAESKVQWPLLVAREEREGGLLAPLFLNATCGTEDAEVERNIRYAVSKKYRTFIELMSVKHLDGPVSVCGSAPSLADDYRNLVGDVIAVNQAHDFLVSVGVTPTYGCLWDSGTVMAGMMTPREGVTYLIGSRCDPVTINKFLPFDPVIWHAMGDSVTQKVLEDVGRYEPMVGGGSGGVTRFIFVAYMMGYRDIHLFGADASCDDDAHVTAHPLTQEYIEVNCMGKWYRTTPQLASQVEDFKLLAPMLKAAGARLTIHGRGLLPMVARELGYDTQLLEDSKHDCI